MTTTSTQKPTLADLRAFITAGQLQSFAAAAKVLHLSQPALSRRIPHLEDVLAVKLFDRTTRSVELTMLGRRFLQHVRSVIDDLDQSVLSLHDVAHLEAGDVTVGCVFSGVHHFLPEVIRSFRKEPPHVLVRIIEEGEVGAGDTIEVVDRPAHGVTSQLVFDAILKDITLGLMALQAPELAPGLVEWLEPRVARLG